MTGVIINNNEYEISTGSTKIEYSSTKNNVSYSMYGDDIPFNPVWLDYNETVNLTISRKKTTDVAGKPSRLYGVEYTLPYEVEVNYVSGILTWGGANFTYYNTGAVFLDANNRQTGEWALGKWPEDENVKGAFRSIAFDNIKVKTIKLFIQIRYDLASYNTFTLQNIKGKYLRQ